MQTKTGKKKRRGRPRKHSDAKARWRAWYWRKRKAEKIEARKVKNEYETPPEIFNPLNEEFRFDLDACANVDNFKCNRFYTLEAGEDGLKLPWAPGPVWCNCPYSGRAEIEKWVKKAANEASQNGVTSVLLIPNSTGARYWHTYIEKKPNVEVRFLPDRVKFIPRNRNDKRDPAPFDSAIVIFRGKDAK